MESNNLHPESEKRWSLGEEDQQKVLKPIYFLPFDVQLQNTFCIEVIARRFPVEKGILPRVNVHLESVQVDENTLQAHVVFHVHTVHESDDNEQKPFEISFKIVGIFTYTETYEKKDLLVFLEQGSLSILLPFARELLLNICTRLQIPPMMLMMVQLAPHPSSKGN